MVLGQLPPRKIAPPNPNPNSKLTQTLTLTGGNCPDTIFKYIPLAQNIELQLMATWVHLSTYLLFVINWTPFKLLNTKSAVSKGSREVFYRKTFS